MPRGYTVATAALAVGTTVKWVDNVLSHISVPGVAQSHQGVARRISAEAVLQLQVAGALSDTLGIPVERAVEAAGHLLRRGRWEVGRGIAIELDQASVLPELAARLEYAVEAAPLPRRGRPPGKAKRGA